MKRGLYAACFLAALFSGWSLGALSAVCDFRWMSAPAALDKAIALQMPVTATLNNELQITGKPVKVRKAGNGEAAYLHFEGPTQLSRAGVPLPGQGPEQHPHGYGTPVGKLNIGKVLSQLTDHETRGCRVSRAEFDFSR